MNSVEKNVEIQQTREFDKLAEDLAKSIVSLRKAAALDDFFCASAREQANLPTDALRSRFIDGLSHQNKDWPTAVDNKRVNEVTDDLTKSEWAMAPARMRAPTAATAPFFGMWVLFLGTFLAVKLLPLNGMPIGFCLLLAVFVILPFLWLPARFFNFIIRRKFEERLRHTFEAVDKIAAFTLRNPQSPSAAK